MADRLKVDALTVAMGDRRASASFGTDLGQFVALAGPSGAGKTTMLRAIAQLVEPAEGSVTLGGRSPEAIGWPVYRRRVVYVGQRPTMLAGSTLENLERPFTYSVADRAFDRDAARRHLEALRFEANILDRRAAELSVGEQQRVALVRALLVEPDVLLLDEPTSALDEEAERAVEALVKSELERRGASAVIVTHQSEQASRLNAERVELSTS